VKSVAGSASPCPDHPASHTWHDGYYGKRGVRGYFQHPRFRCRPDPSLPGTHGFTNHRRMATQGDLFCEHCERVRGKHDGPRTPQDFEFAIGEIAASLYDLASGASYRGTSKLRRREIDRPARIPVRDRDPFSSQGHLARDWLEEFGWIVLDGKEYRAWPRILVVDNKGYRPKLRMPHRGGFHVYAALDAIGQQLVRLTYYPDRSYWLPFLDQLPGEPEVVVVDGDPAILSAITYKWPKARTWRSHWHIQHRQLTNQAIPREGLIPEGNWLADAIEDAFRSEDNWWAFVAACGSELGGPRVGRWLDANAAWVAEQIADADFVPKSTGGVEERLRKVGDRIGERRGFANKARTDLLLRLWALHLNHGAHRDEFTRKIRRHLERTGGRPQKHTRPGGRKAMTGNGHRNCRCHPQARHT
jgi:hypothetical protein